MFLKIWQRYFLKEVLKVFLLLITSFYGLYVLIDYSSRAGSFRHLNLTSYEVFLYYLYTFVQRLDILIPFALLVSTIRTLINLNIQNELVALLAGGIKIRSILFPFLILGLFFTSTVFINSEFFLPKAMQGIRQIEDSNSLQDKSRENLMVQTIPLQDRSSIIYQNFDSANRQFFDVYWLRSIDDIYHMKYLTINSDDENHLTGKFVDHLKRNSSGQLAVKESFPIRSFPEITFSTEQLLETLLPPNDQPLSKLWGQLPPIQGLLSDKEAQILTSFHHKLALPWLSILAVIGPIPFCLMFTRHLPVFFIYICSIFWLLSFYLLMNAALVIGQSQVIHPLAAIWPPIALTALFFYWRFIRSTHNFLQN